MLDIIERGGECIVNDRKNGVATFGDWLLYLLLSGISAISFWVSIIFIFVGKPNIKNYAIANVIWGSIVFVVLISLIIVGVGIGIGTL